jgi:hypothetical protein
LQILRRARDVGFVRITRGHFESRVLSTVIDVGLFDHLASEGFVDVGEFAAAHALDSEVLASLCDYLYALGFFQKTPRGFTLDESGRLVAQAMRGIFDLTAAYEDLLHGLEPILRREARYGQEIQRNARLMARGSGAGGHLFTFPLAANLIQSHGFQVPLDLACGDAEFLIDLCRRTSVRTAYGVDVAPDAIDEGRKRVREERLDDRIRLVVEDAYRLDQVADQLPGVDVITSFYGFQEFWALGRDRLLALIDTCRRAFPGVAFLVCEIPRYSPEELRRNPGGVVEYQLFHRLTGQHLSTLDEWRQLWRDAGFTSVEERYLDFARTVFYLLR